MVNLIILQNKSNSPLIMNNSRNIFDKNGINSGNKNSTFKGNFIYNSNVEFFSKSNKNDINDNVNIFELDDNRSNNFYKSNQIRKNRNGSEDKYNYNSDENEFIKNELNKYRNDVDNIINNYNQKKQSKSFSVLGKNKKRLKNNINNVRILDKYKEDNTSYDNSNNDLIKVFSITKSISNQIQNNENSQSINNDNKKNQNKKKSSYNLDNEENEEEKDDKKNNNRKSRNKERSSPKGKRIFKDKTLKNLVEHLSLIEEESEPSLSVLKRKRRFTFSKNIKKPNSKNKINNIKRKNLKKKSNNINKNDEQVEENKTESIIESQEEESAGKNKDKYSDLDYFNINIINKKDEEQQSSENDNKNKNNNRSKKRKGNNNYMKNENDENGDNNIFDKKNKKIKRKNKFNIDEQDDNEKFSINEKNKINKNKFFFEYIFNIKSLFPISLVISFSFYLRIFLHNKNMIIEKDIFLKNQL